jgi:hypothetical protein
MVEGAATLNGCLHIRMVEGKIRCKIEEQCKQVFFSFDVFVIYGNFQEIGGWTSCAGSC